MAAMLLFPVFWTVMVIWGTTSASWHPVIGAFLVLGGLIAFGLALRRLIVGEMTFQATTGALPIDEYRWLKRWDATHFIRHFNSFLLVHGWRVHTSTAVSSDRVEFVAEKDRCVVALLCVRPGLLAGQADLNHLATLRNARHAIRAALVTEAAPAPEEMQAAFQQDVMRLRFADLERLTEVFHLGT